MFTLTKRSRKQFLKKPSKQQQIKAEKKRERKRNFLKKKFLCDFKPVDLQRCGGFQCEALMSLLRLVGKGSEPRAVLDSPTKPLNPLIHYPLISTEIQVEPDLWAWEWGLSHLAYNTLVVSGQPDCSSLIMGIFLFCPSSSHCGSLTRAALR